MKKNIHLILFTFSALILAMYISFVEPAIDKPIVLGGFFGLLFLTVYWAFILLLGYFKFGNLKFVVSCILSLAIVYLFALSTLNSLGFIDFAIIVISASLLTAFVVGPLRRRRGA